MSFAIPNKTPIPRRESAAPGSSAMADEAPKGDEAVEKTVSNQLMEFEILKAKRFLSKELDRTTVTDRDVAFSFTADDKQGSSVIFEARAHRLSGGTVGFRLDDWILGLWPEWVKTHPAGAIGVAPFPPVTEKAPFLSFPDLKKKKEIARPPVDKDGKLADPPSRSEVEKMGLATEVKQVKIGPVKAHECWRCAMWGTLERVGGDFSYRWVFSSPRYTYAFRLFMRKDAITVFGPDVEKMLASFKLIEPK
jgi:hypothetical protein